MQVGRRGDFPDYDPIISADFGFVDLHNRERFPARFSYWSFAAVLLKDDLVILYMTRLLEIMFRLLPVCMSFYRSGSELEKQEKQTNTSDLMHNLRAEEDW